MQDILAISYYLPTEILSNEDLNSRFPEWNVDKISNKTGIRSRHIAGRNEFVSDMAVSAAEQLFKEHSIDRHGVDFLLLCTQSPDYFLPTTACIIQDRLGLPTTIGALDFNLGCSGFIYGLSIAKGLIAGGMASNVLLITSETYSKYIHPRDKSNLTIFGDAAAACMITSSRGICSVGDFMFGTDGHGAPNLIVKDGALRNRDKPTSDDWTDDFGNIRNDRCLYMNGAEIFNFTSDSVPGLVTDILNKNRAEPDAIDLYVMHQANRYILTHLRKKMGIPEEKFFIDIDDIGNTVSSTIPIALHRAKEKGMISSGAKVIVAGFGVGYSWGGCLLHYR